MVSIRKIPTVKMKSRAVVMINVFNGEPAVLVHHGIVLRWRCGLLVIQRPLSLLLSMTDRLLLSMTYQFQSHSGKD